MLRRSAVLAAALPVLLIGSPVVAMPMSGTFDIHIDKQEVRPLGAPDHVRIQESGAGTNQSPGLPLDGAAVGINEVVVLKRGRGPVRGTITFSTPMGSTVGTYTGKIMTDANGRVTAQGRFTTRESNGAFAGLKGSGTFSSVFSSKTDAITQWSGEFTPPAAMISAR